MLLAPRTASAYHRVERQTPLTSAKSVFRYPHRYPSPSGARERKQRNRPKPLFGIAKIWCCRRGLNSRPLPYQQRGREPPETHWSNALQLLAFSDRVSASTVKYRRVPPKPEISATPALPRTDGCLPSDLSSQQTSWRCFVPAEFYHSAMIFSGNAWYGSACATFAVLAFVPGIISNRRIEVDHG